MQKFILLVAVAISAFFCQSADAVDYTYKIPANQPLNLGDSVSVEDYTFIFQATDGNLVVYRKADNKVIWSSYTGGKGGVMAVVQNDGNFVLYNSAGGAVWNSKTGGRPSDAYWLTLSRDNGSLYLAPEGKGYIWNTPGDVKPLPSCPGGQKMSLYPICVKGNNQSIPACDTADATQYAHSIGGVYGPCR